MKSAILPLLLLPLCAASQAPPTIKDPSTEGFPLRKIQKHFALSWEQLEPAETMSVDSTGAGIRIDLSDTTLFGRVYSGPEYFDQAQSDFPETRYRFSSEITRGTGTLNVRAYFDSTSRSNANDWSDRGILGYRLELVRLSHGNPEAAGVFDSRLQFVRRGNLFFPVITIIEGPRVGLIQSDHPDWIVVGLTTDRVAKAAVEISGGGTYWEKAPAEQHEIRLEGLKPSRRYRYRALAIAGGDTTYTPWFQFQTAPPPGAGEVVFAYAGDGRAASGGGEYEYTGVNRAVGRQIAREVFRKGASFFLFGGDLVSGYINSPDEYRLELLAFRETYGPLLQAVPLYAAVGNHEALLNIFDDGSRRGIAMDKWPYASSSAEAVFAQVMIHPSDGPQAATGRPPYDETAYSFQEGPVKIIVINNDYWITARNRIREYGGSPEGYIFPEQMQWIGKELQKAEVDSTVGSVLLLAHEPVFPAGGHVGDAMWHSGDNHVRAYQKQGDAVRPEGPGIIDVRNQLWSMVSKSSKVALVLGSDEHNYQRFLITDRTPVGLPEKDDTNGNGVLDDGHYSPNPDFARPTWFVISGGAGAPYYSREYAPWWGSSKFFTPQCNYIVFRATRRKISMEVYNTSGQLLDHVGDLLAVHRLARDPRLPSGKSR